MLSPGHFFFKGRLSEHEVVEVLSPRWNVLLSFVLQTALVHVVSGIITGRNKHVDTISHKMYID